MAWPSSPAIPIIAYMMWQEGNLYPEGSAQRRAREHPAAARADAPPERWNWDSPLLDEPARPGSFVLWLAARSGAARIGATAGPPSAETSRGPRPLRAAISGAPGAWTRCTTTGAMSKYATTTAIRVAGRRGRASSSAPMTGWCRYRATAARAGRVRRRRPGSRACIHQRRRGVAARRADDLRRRRRAQDGDFTPYVFVSRDLGRSWRSIAGDLPKGTIVWTIQQDHVRPDLLFAGTEFGTLLDAGRRWQLARARRRRSYDLVPRSEDPPAGQRPRRRDVRSRLLRAGRLLAAAGDCRRRAVG
jgi:hypothetical protein